ncbi:molybdenum cofactor guanylyltransferase [Halodesulfurarchaeum sp.]|uniref:molybdenum cofactor guanylyltransferase n=1 Tax=Halodesulfurarchaeum sp. TaxID=1980530 RepID=UPI001BBA3F85|nr:molybdenum cofactor guanylyltransferase [Halodesulfurarchaeum sp.]
MAVGVLVCGGGSTRFGTEDKVCAELAGRPLVRHVADRITPVIDELVVNCRDSQVECLTETLSDYPLPVTFACDEREDAGPLQGIERGLSAADTELAVVLACDMPFVDPAFIQTLFDQVQDHQVAIPRHGEGNWYQPLQAVYRVDPMLTAINDALEAGAERPIKPALALDSVTLEGEDLWANADEHTFFNVNTQADLETAEAILGNEQG